MSSLRIQDMPDGDRPREKLARRGARALTDAELLAIFLRVGVPGKSAIELARSLIERVGSLHALSRCTVEELAHEKGIGPAKAAQLAAAFELGNRLASERVQSRPMDSPELVYELLGNEMRSLHQERVRVLLLNTRLHLIHMADVTQGTVNESLAHPREILRPALIHCAHAYILVHNHPSGDPSPSRADREMTRRIVQVSKDMGIDLLDHIIIGAPSEDGEPYFSFREMGLM